MCLQSTMCGSFLAELVVVEGFECIITGVAVGYVSVRDRIAACAWAGKNLGRCPEYKVNLCVE